MSEDERYAAWGDEDGDEGTEIVAALEPGTFFADRFQVDGRLGMGAMGKVVVAHDLVSGQRVALKVLHREKAAQREAAERFKREAEVLARLGHPGIVRVVGTDRLPDGTRWLAMELVEGDTIAQRLRRQGPFTIEATFAIITVLCDALDAAHRAGVVHRDLKPENVMLPASGSPACKVLDFGLARVTQAGEERLTRAGTILGTPRYMAPELIENLKDTDHRADVFAVGVITFEMLTGKSIYAAEDVGQLFGAILEGRMRTLASVRPDLPAGLHAIIQRAAARKPAERFQTAGAFAEAYAAALGIDSQRSQLSGAHEMFDDTTQSSEVSARMPLVDPFSPAIPRPAPLPRAVLPGSQAAAVVVTAPVRAVSDRPHASPSIGAPRVSAARLIASQKRTVEGPAFASSPPPPQAAPSFAAPSVPAAVPAPSFAAPAAPPIPPEGERRYSDRPPAYPEANRAAPSVHPPRGRSFTPPLGVTHREPIAPPRAPTTAGPSRTVLIAALLMLVVLAALGFGVLLRFVLERGLIPH
ncbi:MAG: serine/threonine-protein kinase [Sandaracinus sp.]